MIGDTIVIGDAPAIDPPPERGKLSSAVGKGPGQLQEERFIRMPLGLAIEIGAVTTEDRLVVCGPCDPNWETEDSEWSLASISRTKMGKSASSGEEVMVQNLIDESFTKVCVDSGARERVCPVDAFPSYETKKIEGWDDLYGSRGAGFGQCARKAI